MYRDGWHTSRSLVDAVRAGDADRIRNARYQIIPACFDRLGRLEFTEMLKARGISLTTDVKSLHREAPGWNRRLSE